MILILAATFIVLMCCSAFFSSTETAFFSLNPLGLRRLNQKDPAAGSRIRDILNQPTQLLSTILIGNTIVNVAIAAVGFSIAERLIPRYSESVSMVVVTVLLIIFGEAGPKRVGLLLTERLAILYAPIVHALIHAATPLRMVLEKLTQAFEPWFRPRGRTLSEEEFETVLEISREEGILNADELAMINAIIRLEDLKARNVMTPRVDLVGLDLGDDPAAGRRSASTSSSTATRSTTSRGSSTSAGSCSTLSTGSRTRGSTRSSFRRTARSATCSSSSRRSTSASPSSWTNTAERRGCSRGATSSRRSPGRSTTS
jgi:Mg2+/Co2+ transporter CorB